MSTAEVPVSPFMEPDYKPLRCIIKSYHHLAATYFSSYYHCPYDVALKAAQLVFKPGEHGFKEAKVKVFLKDKNGDRYPTIMTSRDFFTLVEDKNWHLSPSLVAYEHADVEQSVNSIGTEQFIEGRSEYKHKRSTVPKGTELWKAYDEFQNALKIFNNAQSGGMSSSGTPLYNKSGHTALTSTCRSLTSTANVINERLITGNRLLLSYNKTMELYVSTLAYANRELIQEVINKYEMNYATVDQVMDMTRRCASMYWNNPGKLEAIRLFLNDLTPLELTIILCSMDIRGLYTCSPEVITRFMSEWCHIPEVPADAKVEDYEKPLNGDYKVLCITKLGKEANDLKIRHLNAYHMEVEKKWGDFITAFFRAKTPPSGIFNVKDMIRENVLTSDTDSMIYSVDLILDSFVKPGESTLPINGVLTYFIRCIAVDQHYKLSVNMNVAKRFQHILTMKNEYLFGSYVTTSMSKHYYALQLMIEGVMNKEPDLEVKGVHLRGIKIAAKVRAFTQRLMRDVLDAIYIGKTLCAPSLLGEVGDLERELMSALDEGDWNWLVKNTVKEETAYSTPESSIYFYHELWESVFADKYGHAPEPPYKACKVVIDLSNKSKMKDYLESIKESNIGRNLEAFLTERDSLTSIYVPADMIKPIGGIPKEIIPVIDKRQLVSQNFKSIYACLESLGIFVLNSKTTRLISDEH